ncbi:hypothetical protein [Deinococcus sedimenti]|uniref:Uncharacterized protein n=1 Tax=Deinococcus sedimenti TaxID=1867090 RepID=A0ABQ2S651_9DEIO|nr:hypothetical protein [Deinococcus sedimenti]GGS01435.1 hypothetical protein GCM10008960_30150 [Deinococcus sedimenti]
MALRPPVPATRRTRLKRVAFVLVVLLSGAAALLAVLVSAQAFDRLTRAGVQVGALSLARRPVSSASLTWLPGPAGARQPDALTLEDLRLAYLQAFSELTYAHRSGDVTGLPGRLSGAALQGALRATQPTSNALVLDWAHRAAPLGLVGDGRTFRLRDDLWTLRARPGAGGWQDVRAQRERRVVTLREVGGVWRVSDWQVTAAASQAPSAAVPLDVSTWRAVTLSEWSEWTRDEWRAELGRLQRAGLAPVALEMPAVMTVGTGRALRLGVRVARQLQLPVVVSFAAPLTLEGLPARVTAGLQGRGALALLPGPLPDSGDLTTALIGWLRAAQPLPLVAEGAPVNVGALGLVSARVGDGPGQLRRAPGPPRLPWKQAGALAALEALPARGWLAGRPSALIGADGQVTPWGAALLKRADGPGR